MINKQVVKTVNEDAIDEFANILSGINSSTPNLQLPSPDLRDFYRDETNRTLWITDKVDESTLGIMTKILYYNRLDKDIPINERKPIKIFIDTLGGDVSVMWSIMSAIQISKTPVWTINWSNALSAGACILASGHKRFAMPGSTVLIHSGSCVFGGTQEQADSAKKYYDSLTKKADAFLLQKTKIDAKMLKKKAPFDWYMCDFDALEYGLVDKIVDDLDEIM